MECIYISGLRREAKEFTIEGEEAKHLRALRLRTGGKVLATSAEGFVHECTAFEMGKSGYLLRVIGTTEMAGEPTAEYTLALGIIDSRDRFEFALEKSIELGVSGFVPLMTQRSQWLRLNPERMKAKAIAAVCQSKRSMAPEIYAATKLSDILESDQFATIILADEDGDSPCAASVEFPALIVIGPEGGLTDKEIEQIKQDKRTRSWKLGRRRLRAETAAIAALSIFSASDIK